MHYNNDYFSWQKKIGELSARANVVKYKNFIKETDHVLDFGSGGGFLLNQIKCKEKIGVEINLVASKYANDNGILTVNTINDVPDEWADVIISSHVLEHTHNPLSEVTELKKKLKKGGKIIFVTPYEKKKSICTE